MNDAKWVLTVDAIDLKWFVSLVVAVILGVPAVLVAEEDIEEIDTEAELEVEADEEAEDDEVALSREQLELHQRAVAALGEEPARASEARRLLESALIVGDESNVLYMTLGRAHQLDGDCAEALEAFDQAEEAPLTAGIPEEQILARIHNYRAQIAEECEGFLVVECRDADTVLESAEIEELHCDEEVELAPGRYQLEASLEGAVTLVSVEVRGGETAVVEIALDAEERRLIMARDEGTRRVRESVIGASQFASALERDGDWEEQTRQEAQDIAEGIVAEEMADIDEEEEEISVGTVVGQLGLSPGFGGYGVQLGDGLSDGGLTFGGLMHGYVGYSIAPGLGTELRLSGSYLESYSLGLKTPDDRDGEASIDLSTLQLDGEARFWVEFFSFGFYGEYRRMGLETASQDVTASTLVAGPTLTFSREAVLRDDGYMSFGTRWGLLGDGDLDRLAFQLEYGVGYATLGFSYTLLAGSDEEMAPQGGDSSVPILRRGDMALLNLGLRIPMVFD